MIRLLQLMFFGHAHKWKIIEKKALSQGPSGVGGKVTATGTRYICQCETCGLVVKRDLI